MAERTREQIFKDLVALFDELRDDWEYSGEITEQTSLLNDLEFESIDAVALGAAVEERYQCSFPFPEFLAELGERDVQDLLMGDLVDFVYRNLEPTSSGGTR